MVTIYETSRKGNKVTAVCRWENTRYGFRHLVALMVNGYEVASAKKCYYNRTWERYGYESAINQAVASVQWEQDQQENEKAIKALKRQFFKKALPWCEY